MMYWADTTQKWRRLGQHWQALTDSRAWTSLRERNRVRRESHSASWTWLKLGVTLTRSSAHKTPPKQEIIATRHENQREKGALQNPKGPVHHKPKLVFWQIQIKLQKPSHNPEPSPYHTLGSLTITQQFQTSSNLKKSSYDKLNVQSWKCHEFGLIKSRKNRSAAAVSRNAKTRSYEFVSSCLAFPPRACSVCLVSLGIYQLTHVLTHVLSARKKRPATPGKCSVWVLGQEHQAWQVPTRTTKTLMCDRLPHI